MRIYIIIFVAVSLSQITIPCGIRNQKLWRRLKAEAIRLREKRKKSETDHEDVSNSVV